MTRSEQLPYKAYFKAFSLTETGIFLDTFQNTSISLQNENPTLPISAFNLEDMKKEN